jgi:hypothetical protein
MINKNYLIFVEKIKNIENKENLPTSIAIAGIKGGKKAEITNETKNIVDIIIFNVQGRWDELGTFLKQFHCSSG